MGGLVLVDDVCLFNDACLKKNQQFLFGLIFAKESFSSNISNCVTYLFSIQPNHKTLKFHHKYNKRLNNTENIGHTNNADVIQFAVQSKNCTRLDRTTLC